MAIERRVRVNVVYGSTYQGGYTDQYTYLVRPEQAFVGNNLTVPVRNGGRIYNTTATVVSTDVKPGGVKRPRKAL